MLLQVCDPATNDFKTWINVKGLIRYKLVRSGGSKPSSFTAYVSANSEEEDTSKVRFWPFQGIRVIETDGPLHDPNSRDTPQAYDVMYFAGRIDSVYLKEDPTRGRMWEINARCWLSVLQDNTINEGKWCSALFGARQKVGYDSKRKWKPTYSQDYGRPDYPWGEYRRFIIWDLVMNIISSYDDDGLDNLTGIERFWYSGETTQSVIAGIPYDNYLYKNGIGTMFPNSLPVQVDFTDKTQSILSCIQRLALTDPWSDGLDGPLGGDIDSVMLARAGAGAMELKFPSLSGINIPTNRRKGIGADLQMQMRTLEDNAGRTAEYIPKGWMCTGYHAYYGSKPSGRDSTPAYAIIEMDFGKDGMDLFTNATAGKDGDLDSSDIQLSAAGNVTNSGASTWDPKKGKFRTIKTKRVDLGNLADDLNKIKGGEQTASQARLSIDAISADIFNTTQISNGGVYRGTITISGRPKSLMTGMPIRPSEVIKLHIPHLGIEWSSTLEYLNIPNSSSDFIVEQFSYEWPDEKTIIEVTRPHPGTLIKGIYEAMSNQEIEKYGWDAISPWIPVHKLVPISTAVADPSQKWGLIDHEWTKYNNLNTVSTLAEVEMESKAGRKGSSWINSSVRVEWNPGMTNIDNNNIQLQFAIWDGFTMSGKFVLSGKTFYRDYNPMQETIRIFDPRDGGGEIKVTDKNKIQIKLPATLQDHVSFMTPTAWANINTAWLTGTNEGGPPQALPYPVDPNRPGWVTRDTGNLLIRIKAKKKS